MAKYRAPGVYVEETSATPIPGIITAQALPIFIGYTEIRRDADGRDFPANTVVRIRSFLEFEARFGRAAAPVVTAVQLDGSGSFLRATLFPRFYLHDSLRLFYANGGTDCGIVSVGPSPGFPDLASQADLSAGISGLSTQEGLLLPVLPDAACLPTDPAAPDQADPVHSLILELLQIAAARANTFVLLSLPESDPVGTKFRAYSGVTGLSYGAAYTPWLTVTVPMTICAADFGRVFRRQGAGEMLTLEEVLTDVDQSLVAHATGREASHKRARGEEVLQRASGIYRGIRAGVRAAPVSVPPGGAVAGQISRTDRIFGEWKVPAGEPLHAILRPSRRYLAGELMALNVDQSTGKSINAIREFPGRGTLIFGARTLAGNDWEYRYISVRRLLMSVQMSVQAALRLLASRPNDAETWNVVRMMIEQFLHSRWREGAFLGSTQEEAFIVQVGLGRTMTPQDVAAGRMLVQVLVAPARPAEFVILQFTQRMGNP